MAFGFDQGCGLRRSRLRTTGLRGCRDLFAAAISRLPLGVVLAGSGPSRETRRCGRSRKNRPGEMARNLLSPDFRRHKTAHNGDSDVGRHSAPAPANCWRPFAAVSMHGVDPSPTIRTKSDALDPHPIASSHPYFEQRRQAPMSGACRHHTSMIPAGESADGRSWSRTRLLIVRDVAGA